MRILPSLDTEEPEYRLEEILQAVKALCRGDRFVSLKYIYGEANKEAIAESCLRFVTDR